MTVRFTIDSVGVVSSDDPYHFDVSTVMNKGDEGTLVESDPPFSVPEGWVIVHVKDDLYAPVHPGMIEVVEA